MQLQKFFGFLAVIIISCFGTSCFAQSAVNYTTRIMVGDKQTYSSASEFSVQGDIVSRTVSYYDLSKKLIRKEASQYKTRPLELISLKLEDYRSGFLQTVQKQSNAYIIKQRKTASESLNETSVNAPGVFSASVMVQLLQQRFDALAQGKEQKFEIVVASRSMTVEMVAAKERTETIHGVACVVVKAEPSSMIYRALAEPSFLYLEQAAPHRLIHYKGILPLPDDKGGQLSGTTISTY
jgi:hypothetical protein